VKNHLPASVAGFLFWCDDLAEQDDDAKAADDEANVVHLGTYHNPKGLEWPVVLCTGLDTGPRPRLWEVGIIADDPTQPFNLSSPLTDRRRRFWPWPFASQERGIPLADRVDASEAGLGLI
jgi:superfamily I DNA/RNA helicase